MRFTHPAFVLMSTAVGILHSQQPVDFLHFRILLPSGYKLKEIERPMMDFNLYKVLAPGGQVVAQIYAGNNPSFSFDSSKYTRRRLTPDTTLVEPKASSGDMLLEFENLRYKSSSQSPWTRVHAFEISKDSAQRQILVTALMSIQIARRNLE
jgi:hypothetical protein